MTENELNYYCATVQFEVRTLVRRTISIFLNVESLTNSINLHQFENALTITREISQTHARKLKKNGKVFQFNYILNGQISDNRFSPTSTSIAAVS